MVSILMVWNKLAHFLIIYAISKNYDNRHRKKYIFLKLYKN